MLCCGNINSLKYLASSHTHFKLFYYAADVLSSSQIELLSSTYILVHKYVRGVFTITWNSIVVSLIVIDWKSVLILRVITLLFIYQTYALSYNRFINEIKTYMGFEYILHAILQKPLPKIHTTYIMEDWINCDF